MEWSISINSLKEIKPLPQLTLKLSFPQIYRSQCRHKQKGASLRNFNRIPVAVFVSGFEDLRKALAFDHLA